MADDEETVNLDDLTLDEQTSILHAVIRGEVTDPADTPAEARMRRLMVKQVAEIRAKGEIPSIPFD